MTGEEHYREAERLLDSVAALPEKASERQVAAMHARAQVHATLALAYAYLPVNVTLEAPTAQEQTR